MRFRFTTESITESQISTNPENRVPPEEDPKIGVPLDRNGTPWIEAVHAGTQTQTKEGVWKKKRGVDDDVVQQAEAEARAKIAATPDPVVPESDPMSDTLVQTEPTPLPMPGAAPAVMPGMPVSDAEPPEPVSLDELAGLYGRAVEAGVLQSDEVLELYQRHGCKEVNDITTNADARIGVATELRERLESA